MADVQQYLYGFQGREDGYVVFHGGAADFVAVQVAALLVQVDGIDHILHMAFS